MIEVSAIVIAFNEEDRIAETVSSLGFCQEVVVVDSGSTDRTREVAAACGARVLTRRWSGYSDQKNHAAECASNDWVFSVDADERPAIELANEIRHWQANGDAAAQAACSMPRRVCYLGKWVRHSGWYPDRKTRLYDRTKARWMGKYVHEELAVEGRIRHLEGDLLHFPYRSLDEHHATIDRYTALAADELRERGRRFNPLRLALGPPLYFLKNFFFRAGLLDGVSGLRIAYMGARYVLIREFRLFRRWN